MVGWGHFVDPVYLAESPEFLIHYGGMGANEVIALIPLSERFLIHYGGMGASITIAQIATGPKFLIHCGGMGATNELMVRAVISTRF